MKKFTLSIAMDNAAFDDGDNGGQELARILRDIAERVEQGHDFVQAWDANGNKVGEGEVNE